MKSGIECIPCFFRQLLSTSRKVTDDEELQLAAFRKAAEVISKLSMVKNPAENTYGMLKAANEALGCRDPFKEEKKKYNRISMEMYPGLSNTVRDSGDPLHTALKVAVAGNIIDLGIMKSFNIKETLERVLKEGFAVDHYDLFRKELEGVKHLVYLLDNAGEIVFDRVLIEELKKHCNVTAVVNEGPIINDATLEDAVETGLDKVVRVITTGTDSIGKPPDTGSEEYRKVFHSADMIIAKGHANYETMNETDYSIFFLLQAKCDLVAGSLGVECGKAVFLKNGNNKSRN